MPHAKPPKPQPPSATASAMPPVEALLCFSLYAANNAMNRVYQPLLEPLGLTYPQYLVLLALWQQDGRSVGQIGAQVGLESNTLTPLLKRMETAGLLARSRSDQDERQVLVSLTAKGRTLRRKAEGIPACILSATGLKLADATALRAQLASLRESLVASMDGET